MDGGKKQQALMDGVVLEDSTLPTASTYFDDENIEYRMEAGDGCSLSDGKIRVTKEGAQLKLIFHGLTDSENYLIADNLDYDSLSPRELISERKWTKMSNVKPDLILIDALTHIETHGIPYKSIIKGDAKEYSIAAASIIAKVTRDRMMIEWDKIFPQYGFAKHKGYGTAAHIQALKENGPCMLHRKSFIKKFV